MLTHVCINHSRITEAIMEARRALRQIGGSLGPTDEAQSVAGIYNCAPPIPGSNRLGSEKPSIDSTVA
jgi:hypothetical protein